MLRVNIVGIGPGNPDLLTGAARKAIEKSNILIGDKRMLAAALYGAALLARTPKNCKNFIKTIIQ